MATKNLKVKTGISSKDVSFDTPHVGMIFPFAGTAAPSGWLMCDGSAVSSTTYPLLYALIGATTPDLRGKYVVGTSGAVNSSAGANNHTHTQVYSATNTDTVTYNHSHNVYNNRGLVDDLGQNHSHAANHSPYINAFGNTTTSKTGTSQGNLTNRNHNHSAAGGYWTANINTGYTAHNHSANNAGTNASSPTHSHSVGESSTETLSSNTAINIPPTIYVNFIVKAG